MSDMQKLQENLLNAFPEAALLLSRGHVAAANQVARHLLPRLEDGGEVPLELERLPEENGGLVTVGGSAWRVQMTQTQWGRLIVLLPAVQTAVTAAQLDGSLRQMRTYLAQMQLAAEDIPLSSRGMFWKSYHQMFRLMDNLDLLRQLGQPGGAALQLAALDLTALCRRAVQSCTWLLERAGVKLAYTGANSRLGLSGEKVSGLSDVSHTIGTPADVVTIGTGESTVVGADKYDFENVQPADIISGSAHLKGTYLIPNPDNTATTGFSMQLTSGEGSARTIALRDKIPVERNKATLIRIYVLGENVFTTGVDFEVEVDTVWDGSNFVDGEID